jgi:hypothetical protein
VPNPPHWHAPLLASALAERLGLHATVRRCLAVQAPPVSPQLTFIYLMEGHNWDWQAPADSQWATREALDTLAMSHPEQRAVIASWFTWESRDGGARRPAWYRRGWYKGAAAWVGEQLAERGVKTAGTLTQLRSWQRSVVLRQYTSQGTVYFKAVPPFFAHEGPLTAYLHNQYPNRAPRVLACHATEPWMLLEGVGDDTLADVPDLALFERALSLYAEMQIQESVHLDALLRLGVPDRRLARIAQQVDALLEDTAALFVDEPRGLSSTQVDKLRSLVPWLKELCAELVGCGLPETLDHGDLWPMQIAVRQGEPVFMDWSDASVTHPFFSPGFFTRLDDPIFLSLEVAGKYLAPQLLHARQRFRDAYLEPWTSFAAASDLRELYGKAQILAGVHYALLYQRHILPGMEIRWEMENMLPWHLKKSLAAYDQALSLHELSSTSGK